MQSFKSSIWYFLYITVPFYWRHLAGMGIGGTQPHFQIIGTQRGGTTSLFNYLQFHSHIRLPMIKEIHYFDLQFHKSDNWYFAHFPLRSASKSFLTGEASPYYLFHPDVPQRLAELLPESRLIILLRDPVLRAYSHYQHNCKLGLEKRSFEEAIKKEMKIIQAMEHNIIRDSERHRHHSYLARGLYAEQLRRWYRFFPEEQFLLLQSNDLFTNPRETLVEVLNFLNLEPDKLSENEFFPYNQSQSDAQSTVMQVDVKRILAEFYRPYNQALAEQFKVDITGWIKH